MKGKVAFILGAAVGYVLGSRAGRERYEQIKQGATSLWNSKPVQSGVEAVNDVARGQFDKAKDAAARAGASALQSFLNRSEAAPGGDETEVRSTEASSVQAESDASTKSPSASRSGSSAKSSSGSGAGSKKSGSGTRTRSKVETAEKPTPAPARRKRGSQ